MIIHLILYLLFKRAFTLVLWTTIWCKWRWIFILFKSLGRINAVGLLLQTRPCLKRTTAILLVTSFISGTPKFTILLITSFVSISQTLAKARVVPIRIWIHLSERLILVHFNMLSIHLGYGPRLVLLRLLLNAAFLSHFAKFGLQRFTWLTTFKMDFERSRQKCSFAVRTSF